MVGDVRPVKDDATLVRAVDTGDAFDKRGLAGTVVAKQGDDLARVNIKVDIVNRGQAAEVLADATGGQDGFRHWVGTFPAPIAID